MTNQTKLSEADVKRLYITPAIEAKGWGENGSKVIMEYGFTAGAVDIASRGRHQRKYADYLLSYKANLPLAIVEAKTMDKPVGAGMQQALEYAEILDIPYVYSSNGKSFLEHDRLTGAERELPLEEFPTRQDLWQRYTKTKAFTSSVADIVSSPYYVKIDDKKPREPRYYQRIAINRTIEAIAKGQKRILLVMATGTGKTYTAFQIIHRLREMGVKKKILFLADRNILVDQAIMQDFKPFGNVMTKIEGKNIEPSFEVYLGLYQQMDGEDSTEVFKQVAPSFFDLIVIDECHRGSADSQSRWRKVLTYFKDATHIGLTATPKETKTVSNQAYFGEPIYTYSLKQGIADGFLAPYRVFRIHLDVDIEGVRIDESTIDKHGNLIEPGVYTAKDFDRKLVIDERTKAVARRVTEFLKKGPSLFAKTIVFCTDIDHAERMRQALVNENCDLVAQDSRYVMRITGDEHVGKAQLDNFIDPQSKYPVIVTTSKLLTTGVDCKTCENIVLDTPIGSMTEFKQIIGRGTRIYEFDHNSPSFGLRSEDDDKRNKLFFNILDFRNVTDKFYDPEFDGEADVIMVPPDEEMPGEDSVDEGQGDTNVPSGTPSVKGDDTPTDNGASTELVDVNDTMSEGKGSENDPMVDTMPKIRKFYIQGRQVEVVFETESLVGLDGQLIINKVVNHSSSLIKERYATLEIFMSSWSEAHRKTLIVQELENQGVNLSAIRDNWTDFKDIDDFDLICRIAYGVKPKTRQQRATRVKASKFYQVASEDCKKVLNALLEKYEQGGIVDIEELDTLRMDPFRDMGSPFEIAGLFGGRDQYVNTTCQMVNSLYF